MVMVSQSLIQDFHTWRTLFQGSPEHCLYPVRFVYHPHYQCHPVSLLSVKSSQDIWHQRIGHPSYEVLSKFIQQTSLPLTSKVSSKLFCPHCQLGKSKKLPFCLSSNHCHKPLQVITSDVWGPSTVQSKRGNRYYVSFVDEWSRYTWIFSISHKSDVFKIFLHFKAYVENLLDCKIQTFRTDNGGEYNSIAFTNLLSTLGIHHQLTCPHTSEQNGIVKRKHRHILDLSRVLLTKSGIPFSCCDEVFETAVFLINRLPSKTLQHMSPHQHLFHKVPDYSFFKVFGCECYPWLQPYTHSKLKARSKLCVFLGYSSQHKGYKCLDMSSGTIILSRHVVFNEQSFPFHTLSLSLSSFTPSSQNNTLPLVPSLFPYQHSHGPCPTTCPTQLTIPLSPLPTNGPNPTMSVSLPAQSLPSMSSPSQSLPDMSSQQQTPPTISPQPSIPLHHFPHQPFTIRQDQNLGFSNQSIPFVLLH